MFMASKILLRLKAPEIYQVFRRPFHSSKEKNKHKGQSASSNKWLERKYRDIFTKQAGRENYRCRSAYKLIQINEKFNLLHPGGVVIDCGSSPGSWCQVAAQSINATNSDLSTPIGTVIGIDLKHVLPVAGATILGGHDFTAEKTQQKVRDILQGRKADVILSDMAPAATGNKAHNHDNIVQLCFSVLRFSLKSLQPGGATVIKLWSGPGQARLSKAMDTMFDQVTPFKPKASYDDSAELFLVGTGFKLK